jgi:hypothetical protein
MSLKGAKVRRTEGSFQILDLIQISSRRGGGNVGIGTFDFQGPWESRRGLFPRGLFHGPSLCAVHVRQFEGASPLSNLVEVKD